MRRKAIEQFRDWSKSAPLDHILTLTVYTPKRRVTLFRFLRALHTGTRSVLGKACKLSKVPHVLFYLLLRVFHHHCFDDFAHILACVAAAFEALVHFRPCQNGDGVLFGAVKPVNGVTVQAVARLLKLVYFDNVIADKLRLSKVVELRKRKPCCLAALVNDGGKFDGIGAN